MREIPHDVERHLANLKSQENTQRSAAALLMSQSNHPWSAVHIFESLLSESDNYTYASIMYSLAEISSLSASLAIQVCLRYRDVEKKIISVAIAIELGLLIPEDAIQMAFEVPDWALKLLLLTYCLKNNFPNLVKLNLAETYELIQGSNWQPLSNELDISLETAWLTNREFALRYFENVQHIFFGYWPDGETK